MDDGTCSPRYIEVETHTAKPIQRCFSSTHSTRFFFLMSLTCPMRTKSWITPPILPSYFSSTCVLLKKNSGIDCTVYIFFFRYIARRWTMKYQHFILWTYMKAVMLHQMYYSERGDSVHVWINKEQDDKYHHSLVWNIMKKNPKNLLMTASSDCLVILEYQIPSCVK